MRTWAAVILVQGMLLSTSVDVRAQADVLPHWKQTNGPYGGRASCFTSMGDTVFVGTSDGVYWTTNTGANWTSMSEGLELVRVESLAPVGLSLFAACSTEGGSHDLYEFSQEERRWFACQAFNEKYSSPSLVVTIEDVLFASGQYGSFYRTSDQGDTWTVTEGQRGFDAVISFAGYVFGGNTGGVFRSSDLGVSFEPTSLDSVYVSSLAAKGGHMYAVTQYWMKPVRQFFHSADTGRTWDTIEFGDRRTHCLAFADNRILMGTVDGVLTYEDGVWGRADSGLPSIPVYTISQFGSTLFAGTDRGVYVASVSDLIWRHSSNGIKACFTHAVSMIGSNLFCGTKDNGLFMSSDLGDSWTSVLADVSITQKHGLFSAFGRSFLATEGDEGFYTSDDEGLTWQEALDKIDTTGYDIVQCFAVQDSILYMGLDNSQGFKSTDSGHTWESFWFDMSGASTILPVGDSLVIGSRQTVRVYGWTQERAYMRDLATGWPKGDWGQPEPTPRDIIRFADTYIGVSNYGVYIKSDTDTVWRRTKEEIGGPVSTVVAVGSTLLVGTEGAGLYRSLDSGATWHAFNSGLKEKFILTLETTPTHVVAGTRSGVWMLSIDSVATSVDDDNASDNSKPGDERTTGSRNQRITSLNITPNPSTSKASIAFELASSGYTTLNIVNIRGECLATLLSEHCSAGSYAIPWISSEFAEGVYYVQLQSGDAVQSSVLMRAN